MRLCYSNFMIKHNQDGAVSGELMSLILAVVLLLGAIGFGVWAFMGRQDYKDHTDAKIAAAVKVAVAENSTAKDKQFAEDAKNPLKTYNGPEAYGSIVLQYPKTWSGYVSEANNGSNDTLVDGYFNPGVVPSVTDQGSVFALRIQVLSRSYSQVLTNLNNSQQPNKPRAITPYALPKVPKVVGVKVTGPLANNSATKTGTTIILPLRSETLEIWTEGDQFLPDLNNYILPNFEFSP